MAKIYEALRRAEAERKQRAGGESGSTPALDWDPAPEQSEASAPRARWRPFAGRRRRQVEAATTEAYADMNRCRIALVQPDSYAAEQFRTLRTRIDSLASQRPLASIAVMSPNPGDGRTTAAVNLAAVTAMGVDRKIALVDCNLRSPRIASILGLEPRTGLAEILAGEASLEEAVIRVEDPGFDVIAVRQSPPNPSELIGSEAMRRFLEDVAQRYERVFIDTPAALGLPDARVMCELCDGILVVVRADQTPRDDIEMALDLVDRRRVLGAILNSESSPERSHAGNRGGRLR